MGVAIWLPNSPLAHYLTIQPLPVEVWGSPAVALVAYVGLTHFMKTWFIKTYGVD